MVRIADDCAERLPSSEAEAPAAAAAAGDGAGDERGSRFLRRRHRPGRRHDQRDPQRGLLSALRDRADHRRVQGDERFEPAAAGQLYRADPQRLQHARRLRRRQCRRQRRARVARRTLSGLVRGPGRRGSAARARHVGRGAARAAGRARRLDPAAAGAGRLDAERGGAEGGLRAGTRGQPRRRPAIPRAWCRSPARRSRATASKCCRRW